MPERKLVVDQLKLTYEGPMDVGGLFKMIDGWFYEKGYDRFEAENTEQDLPGGKDITIVYFPWKKTTDYFENQIKIRMKFTGVKDIELEKDGKKVKVQTGKLMMIFDGYLLSDYEGWWDKKPWMIFLRTLYDKFIYAKHFKQFERWLMNDVYDIHSRVQRHLNLYRYDRRVG